MTLFTTKVNNVDIIDASHVNELQNVVGLQGQNGICEGRLTLLTATPITQANQSAKTTVYFTPYSGDRVALYNGSTGWYTWHFTEKSVAVPSTTVTPFDIFAYYTGSAVALEALSWTNDTTRATALTTQDGVYVKTGQPSRRYLGTGRTTSSSGQTADTVTQRFLWNYYHRIRKPLVIVNGTGHTYNTATWRPFNNSQANSQVEQVTGVGITANPASLLLGSTIAAGNSDVLLSIGVGTTSAQSTANFIRTTAVGTIYAAAQLAIITPSAGYQYYCMNEYSTAAGTAPSFNVAELEILWEC